MERALINDLKFNVPFQVICQEEYDTDRQPESSLDPIMCLECFQCSDPEKKYEYCNACTKSYSFHG